MDLFALFLKYFKEEKFVITHGVVYWKRVSNPHSSTWLTTGVVGFNTLRFAAKRWWVRSEVTRWRLEGIRYLILPPVSKRLFYLPYFFVPKWLSSLSAQLEIWGSKSNIFTLNFHQEVFPHCNLKECCRVVVVFICFQSHTTNYLVNG